VARQGVRKRREQLMIWCGDRCALPHFHPTGPADHTAPTTDQGSRFSDVGSHLNQ